MLWLQSACGLVSVSDAELHVLSWFESDVLTQLLHASGAKRACLPEVFFLTDAMFDVPSCMFRYFLTPAFVCL